MPSVFRAHQRPTSSAAMSESHRVIAPRNAYGDKGLLNWD